VKLLADLSTRLYSLGRG